MRVLAKLFVFFFSILHRIVMVIWNAHVFMLGNLFARHPDADRPRAVKRG
jgi:hypothetical protein